MMRDISSFMEDFGEDPDNGDMSRLFRRMECESILNEDADAFRRAENHPKQQKIMIRNMLRGIGTDVNKNDSDPLGDGDQIGLPFLHWWNFFYPTISSRLSGITVHKSRE